MLRVALVHDWLTGMRGGEFVLEAIAEVFPKSDLLTLIAIPGRSSPILSTLKRKTSFLQKIPGIESSYRYFLPLMPRAIESFDASSYDLIISSSHCVAKGIRKRTDAVHVSYVHAPMRYIWDRYEDYFGVGRAGLPKRLVAQLFRSKLQEWDRRVSQPDRVDTLIANSQFIAIQIQKAYGRDSEVIYPFADLKRFQAPRNPGRNYLMVTAFAPNKRVDLAIDAFNRMKLPLLIIGGGQEEGALKKRAGPTIDFLGPLSNAAIADLYSKCRAFVFPGVEDFGITPLEAMASGAPVIAYGAGGALETVTSETGVFFREQTVDSLCDAVSRVESGRVTFSEEACRKRASEFTRKRFQKELKGVIEKTWSERRKDVAALQELFELSWEENG